MTNAHNTPWLVQSGLETTIVDSMDNELAQVFAPDTSEQLEIARLMAAAPAQALVLDLVRHRLATITDGEVGFDGVVYAYDPYAPDWSALVDAIGWGESPARRRRLRLNQPTRAGRTKRPARKRTSAVTVSRLCLLHRPLALPRFPVSLYRDAQPPLGGKRPDSGDDFLNPALFPMPDFFDRERRDFPQLRVRQSRQSRPAQCLRLHSRHLLPFLSE